MSYECFKVMVSGTVAHVQLCRPEQLNTMNRAFWRELPICLREIEANAETRVVVISSTGKHYCAGMDLAVFSDPKSIPLQGEPGRIAENLRRTVMQLQASISSLEQIRIPVLVAIQGACIGGGLAMVSAADCRFCTEDAYFSIKETELGMVADVGTLQRLPKLIPQGIARELAYTARSFDAQEALKWGFVNQVYSSHERMIEGVLSVAEQMAKHSPLAVSGTKEMLNYGRDHSVAESLNCMATWQSGMFRPEDMLRALQARQSKKPATFEPLLPVRGVFEPPKSDV